MIGKALLGLLTLMWYYVKYGLDNSLGPNLLNNKTPAVELKY